MSDTNDLCLPKCQTTLAALDAANVPCVLSHDSLSLSLAYLCESVRCSTLAQAGSIKASRNDVLPFAT